MYLEKLNQQLDEFHLLKHPFYVAWNNGELNKEILKDYAEQYYQHIKAFPRYISATHSICEDIENRKILLDNLSDEEDFTKDHPMLWKNFALAVGADENTVETIDHENFTKEMIDNFFRLSRSTYAEGLGALYAYERQVPEIADTVVPEAILVPKTESPTEILVASATVRVLAAADKSRVPVVWLLDKNVTFDGDGNAVATPDNPNAMTFDPGYVYGPNQGIRGFIGLRVKFNNFKK